MFLLCRRSEGDARCCSIGIVVVLIGRRGRFDVR